MTPEELFEQNVGLIPFVINSKYPTYVYNDDVYQEAAIGLWKACLNYSEDKSEFSTFAVHCISNSLKMYFRKECQPCRRPDQPDISLEAVLSDSDGTLTLSDVVGVGDGYIDFKGFLESLTPRQKEIVILKICERATNREIAKRLGCSTTVIWRELVRVKSKFDDYI